MYALDRLFVVSERTPSRSLSAKIRSSWRFSLVPTGQCPLPTPGIASVQCPSTSVDFGEGVSVFCPQFAVVGPQCPGMYPLASYQLQILLEGCPRDDILNKIGSIQTDMRLMGYPHRRGRRLPVQTVGSENTLLTDDNFIQRYITHREPKPVGVFGDDVHTSADAFSSND